MRQRNDEVFHNEAGFLSWDAERALVMQSFAIPRGLAMVAGGTAQVSNGDVLFNLQAAIGDGQWTISQAPFLQQEARTTHFTRTYHLEGDRLTYEQTARIEIYGRTVTHTDTNVLTRQ